jgi:hypothetical protein
VEKLIVVAFAGEDARKTPRAANAIMNLSMMYLSKFRIVAQSCPEKSPLLPKEQRN